MWKHRDKTEMKKGICKTGCIRMKIQQKLLAMITMLSIMTVGFSVLDVKAEELSGEADWSAEIETASNTVSSSDLPLAQEPAAAEAEEKCAVMSDPEALSPMFDAYIEYSPQGYVVMGTFTEFSPDISSIRPWYSLDGENWHLSGTEWDLNWNDEDEKARIRRQTQICLYSNYEPLRSYLSGKRNRIYLKLCVAREDGSTFETQTAILERGAPQPLPEDFSASARFDSSILVSQMRPYTNYGRYQLTVSADAASEEIAALLPDTLPVEIQFQRDNNFVAGGVVDCPVTWKPLILPKLTAGDSVTILDAAEEIVVPEGTLVNTPIGIYQLNEELRIDQFSATDEVRLVLNVAAEDGNPTGVLRSNQDGLEMAFDLKPTGATAIHAYVISDGASEWEALSGLSLLEEVNSWPSAPSSGYSLIMEEGSELYRKYLTAKAEGEEPAPFYVGIKIEGGVYDGRQLVLVWPDTYHEIPRLPDMRGAGGNVDNAGANNKGDSTEGGQRPNLPRSSAEIPGEQQGQSQNSAEALEGQSEKPAENSGGLSSGQSQDFAEADTTEETEEERLSVGLSSDSGDESGGQRPDLQQNSGDRPVERSQEPGGGTDTGVEEFRQTVFLMSGANTGIQIPEKTDSNTQMSTPIGSRSLLRTILLTTVIAVSCICIIIVTGKGRRAENSDHMLRGEQRG